MRAVITLSLLLGMQMAGYADSGKIAGTVVDEYGDGVFGAAVQIPETDHGMTVQNLDGSYAIPGVEPGEYTVWISSYGYGKQVIQGVQVTAGQTTELDIVLAELTLTPSEYVIEWRKPEFKLVCTSSHPTPPSAPKPEGSRSRVNTVGVPASILVKYNLPSAAFR